MTWENSLSKSKIILNNNNNSNNIIGANTTNSSTKSLSNCSNTIIRQPLTSVMNAECSNENIKNYEDINFINNEIQKLNEVIK